MAITIATARACYFLGYKTALSAEVNIRYRDVQVALRHTALAAWAQGWRAASVAAAYGVDLSGGA